MNKFRLASQYLSLNITGIAFLVLAWVNGWINEILTVDTTYVCYVIFTLFTIAFFSGIRLAISLSRDLERVETRLPNDFKAPRSFEIYMFTRISHIRAIANGLVVLGLIGTVFGFIIIAGDVNAETASNVDQVGALVGTLLHGMGVAFYTTLVGAIFSLWLSLNYQILHSATANVVARITDNMSYDIQQL